MKFLRRLVSYARVSPRLAVTLLVLTILDSFWAPVFPVVTSKIQNEVIPNRDFQALWFCIGLVLAVGLVRDLMSFVRTRTSGKLGQLINFNLRAALYGKLQRLPVRWFDRQRTGDIMTRIADDVPAMERVINEGMETFVRLLFQVIAVAGTLFWTNVASVVGNGWTNGDYWTLMTYSGLLTDNGLDLGTLPSLDPGLMWTLDTSASGEVRLSIAIPEPSTWALVIIGSAAIACLRRRRRV